jgi:hypothetical protein
MAKEIALADWMNDFFFFFSSHPAGGSRRHSYQVEAETWVVRHYPNRLKQSRC